MDAKKSIMAIKIKAFELEGEKYISVETYKNDKWVEQSFEYTDNDTIEMVVALIEKAVNDILEYDPSR